MDNGIIGQPTGLTITHYAQSGVLPMPPSDGEVARRIVRHGLAPYLRWLGEDVGPAPHEVVHAIQIGTTLYCSRELWADIEGMRLTQDVAREVERAWQRPKDQRPNPQPQPEGEAGVGPSLNWWER